MYVLPPIHQPPRYTETRIYKNRNISAAQPKSLTLLVLNNTLKKTDFLMCDNKSICYIESLEWIALSGYSDNNMDPILRLTLLLKSETRSSNVVAEIDLNELEILIKDLENTI